MALFKISKGSSANLPVNKPDTTEGYCYFTPDDGKFYIDIDTKTNDTSGRIVLNADKADRLNVSGPVGHTGNPIYLDADGKPVDCGYQRRIGVEGNGAYAEIFNYNGDDPNFVNNIANGNYSHAEGYVTAATGKAAHAEGGNIGYSGQETLQSVSHRLTDGTSISIYGPTAAGNASHAEGYGTLAYGYSSHAEGYKTLAEENYSHAEGYHTGARGFGAHAEGDYSYANGSSSHAEGYSNSADGSSSHAEGVYSWAKGDYSHAEGYTTVFSDYGHSEGSGTQVAGQYSHAEGCSNSEISLAYTADIENKILTLLNNTEIIANNGRNMQDYFSFNDSFGQNNYGFAFQSDYYCANNLGIDDSYALGEFEFFTNSTIFFKVINYCENGYDFFIFGNINQTLTQSSSADSSYYQSFKTSQSQNEQLVVYEVNKGDKIQVKFRKDGSKSETGETAKFRLFILPQHISSFDWVESFDPKNKQIKYKNDGYQGWIRVYNTLGEGSHSEGFQTSAQGNYGSHSEGYFTVASGHYGSHAEGQNTTASGTASHAEGSETMAFGDCAHAEGNYTKAFGNNAHAEGSLTVASGDYSHAEGYSTTASGKYSHTEGRSTIASSDYSHTEGSGTIASSTYSHAEGYTTQANGSGSHAEGYYSIASGSGSHAEGDSSEASGHASHAEGYITYAIGVGSHAEGGNRREDGNSAGGTTICDTNGNSVKTVSSTTAEGVHSHAEGCSTYAGGRYSHSEGNKTQANGSHSHAEGTWTQAHGEASHAEGYYTKTIGNQSHAEGNSTNANGSASHAEGYATQANGSGSHTEGYYSIASGAGSHAEGWYSSTDQPTTATGSGSHAEGCSTQALDYAAHAEGYRSVASGYVSHAEGSETTAAGTYSHAEGNQTMATARVAHAEGGNYASSGSILSDCKIYDSNGQAIKTISSTAAEGIGSHAEGIQTYAGGYSSHSEGRQTQAHGEQSHAEGWYSRAYGESSHAEGGGTAYGRNSHAEGYGIAKGQAAHAEGSGYTLAQGNCSHAEGDGTVTNGLDSHAEGYSTKAQGNHSHAEGKTSCAVGEASHAEGGYSIAIGNYSHAEGYSTGGFIYLTGSANATTYTVSTSNSSFDDISTLYVYCPSTNICAKINSWSNGTITVDKTLSSSSNLNSVSCRLMVGGAIGNNAHSEGLNALAIGNCSHAEGGCTEGTEYDLTFSNGTVLRVSGTVASGFCSHAEGSYTYASGGSSHAEGSQTASAGTYSHAEGFTSIAEGQASHAEGYKGRTGATTQTVTTTGSTSYGRGAYSHAEGYGSTVYGYYSHAEGCGTLAQGRACHSGGHGTIANDYQYAIGVYNSATTGGSTNTIQGSAFIIGNGTSSNRKNAFRVTYAGQVYGQSSYSTGGADYAEYFEWSDGNPNMEDRVGYFVTFDNESFIRKANANDYVLGIVSGSPAVLGNADECWSKQLERDEWNRFIMVETDIVNEDTGEIEKGLTYKFNPDYDSSLKYIPRSERPEWDAIGMIGMLSVRDDGSCKVNGYCKVADGGIATASDSGYRVVGRISDNIIRVIFK